ncbi:FMN-binding domain protein [Verrucomicrobiia bacterium DG1235]|nr:FMN-binding domain protein [Verrucomicrobiae bacterium DG1235]
MNTLRFAKFIALALLASAYSLFGDDETEDVYLAPEKFLSESFEGAPPKAATLWITKDLKPEIRSILGHDYKGLRIRYWISGERTAWILEEIGKVKPITVGIVVESDKIARLKVLVYRESHGWEVKYPFFTDQFIETELTQKRRLSQNIDGISGATLSVNALKRLARLALFLHPHTQPDTDG